MIPYRYSRRALLVATAFIPLVASAQLTGRDPLNSPTTGPTTPYQSAFTEYKNYQDPELMSWRAANDVVREFGSMAQMEGMGGDKATESTEAGGPQDQAGKASKPAEPAHDAGKLNEATKTREPKATPNADMKGMEGMSNTPGHDMGNMKNKAAPARQPAPVTKPAVPQAMPDHSSMQKQ
jgi:hypothetical protein